MSQNQYSQIVEECTQAIKESKNMEILDKLTIMPSREWCLILNRLGNTLLQESIKCYNTKAFDFLLKFQDLVSLEKTNVSGKTALMLALDVHLGRYHSPEELQTLEYFATKLIEYGVFIHGVYNNETFLDKALVLQFIKVVELLLEKGIDVNFIDKYGNTSLHKILSWNQQSLDEFVPLLLCYGADPFIENERGYLPFEYAVKYNHTSIQEILFNYTFDEHTSWQIHTGVLFKLAQSNHQLYCELLHNNKITFVIKDVKDSRELIDVFDHLVDMNIEDLRRLINNHSAIIKKLIIKILTYNEAEYLLEITSEHLYFDSIRNFQERIGFFEVKYRFPFDWRSLTSVSKMDHLNILFESKIKNYIQELLFISTPAHIFKAIIAKNHVKEASQLLTFLLSYGLKFTKVEYGEVYLSYGYCELFKLMLVIGSDETNFQIERRSPMCRFICEMNFDMEKVFSMVKDFINPKSLMVLLDYFTNAKLTKYLSEFVENQMGDCKEELLSRIAMQPTIPCLVELSRNVFRKYIIDKFEIKNESRFYSMVSWLPISKAHQKIITYETKLYGM